jgi:hypothetical protein
MPKTGYVSLLTLALMLCLFVGCSSNRGDTEIANDVQNKIDTDSSIATKQVAVVSSNGVVTLSGTVGNDAERTTASSDASQVKGVKTVLNELHVAPASVAAAPSQMTRPVRPRRNSSGASLRMTSAPVKASEVRDKAPTLTIPEGTAVSIRLVDSIDSDKNKAGDTFSATLETPLMAEGLVGVPKNADVEGRIQELNSAGHFAGRSQLSLVLTKLSFNGKSYEIQTDEFTQAGNSRGKRTAATVGGGAALGALIGGLTSGGKGALIGAGAGAGAGTAVQAVTKGQQIHLPSESVLEFKLNAPLTVR